VNYGQLENREYCFKDASSGQVVNREYMMMIVRVLSSFAIVGPELGAFYRSLTNLAEQAAPI